MTTKKIINTIVTTVLAMVTVLAAIASVGAQPAPARIGVLTPGGSYDPVLVGFREGMSKLGLKEGRDVSYLVEDSKGDVGSLNAQAMKLAEAKPDVILTVATAPALAAKKATPTIPVVFTVIGDPVQAGVVASFASSQNNVTGISSMNSMLSGKRLEILKELAPQTKKTLAIVASKETSAQISIKYLAEAGSKAAIQIIRRDVTSKEESDALFRERWSTLADSVIAVPSVYSVSHMALLIEKTKSEKLPLIVYENSHVELGALASYSGDFHSFGVQAASLVARILLKKTKPADIPVETPERLFLSLNLATAKLLGLKIPRNILDRADRLID